MIQIFRLLEDGAWHSLKEIAEEVGVSIGALVQYCENVSKKEVIEYDIKSGRVRLGHELINIIQRLKADDEAEAEWNRMGAGTAIVPPGKGFQVQAVLIQNMTEEDLKIEFTFNAKPKEIVISMA